MTPTQTSLITRLDAMLESKADSWTKTPLQHLIPSKWTGSQWQTWLKPLVDKSGKLVRSKLVAARAALDLPVIVEQPTQAAGPLSPVPLSPPYDPNASSVLRNLYNENKLSGFGGKTLNVQNSGRDGTTQTDGKGYFRFWLRDKDDQRPSEKRPKSNKRRSEISGITAPAPGPGEVQSFKGCFRFKAQPFADNMQWVAAQRHPGDDTGHPELAFRMEKGGFVVLSVCNAPGADSIDVKTKRKLTPDVWHAVELKDIGGQRAELWIDGKLWAFFDGKVGYQAAKTPYWKCGLYNAQGSNEESVFEWADLMLNGLPVVVG